LAVALATGCASNTGVVLTITGAALYPDQLIMIASYAGYSPRRVVPLQTSLLPTTLFAELPDVATTVDFDVTALRAGAAVGHGTSGAVVVTPYHLSSATVALSGTGLESARLTLSRVPSDDPNDFGFVAPGSQSAAKTFRVTNGGQVSTGSLTTSPSGMADQFALTDGCNGGSPLAPGASCDLSIKFAPTSAGMKSFGFTVADRTGSGGMVSDSVTGTGGAPSSYMVSYVARSLGPVTGSMTDGMGIACSGPCSGTVMYAPGTVVTVTASPGAGAKYHFKGSTGCLGQTCTFTVDGDKTIDLTFLGYNYVFVTSTQYNGALKTAGDADGVTAADAKCMARAQAAGLPGNYVAWISQSTPTPVNAISRLGAARGWVRVDGKPFGDQLSTMVVPNGATPGTTSGAIYYPARLDEHGNPLDTAYLLTGTDRSGNLASSGGAAPSFWDCSGWTVSAGTGDNGQAAVGTASGGTIAWTNFSIATCSITASLLCMGVDFANPVAPPPPPTGSRIAFLSRASAGGGGINGLAGADAMCAGEAMGLLPGTFKAYLSTTTVAAASRFSAAGGDWYRPDGVKLVANNADLFVPMLAAPLNVTASRRYYYDVGVWTGSAGASSASATASTDSCMDWTSSQASLTGTVGSPTVAAMWEWSFTKAACNAGTYRLYCVQQ
jgi:hypothetical protein